MVAHKIATHAAKMQMEKKSLMSIIVQSRYQQNKKKNLTNVDHFQKAGQEIAMK